MSRPASVPVMSAATVTRPSPGPVRGGVRIVWLWELEKLAAQWRARVAFLLCLTGPFGFALAADISQNVPADTLFGRWIKDSGFAIPLVVLGFSGSWALPLLISIVAGDIFSSENQLSTWKTILTRSRSRRSIYAGKLCAVATYTIVIIALLALSSLAAGLIVQGHQPLVSLSGTLIPPGRAMVLVLVSWASVLPVAAAFAAFAVLVSVLTRNSLAGIIVPTLAGLLLQLLLMVEAVAPVRALLPSSAFIGWHGLFAVPSFSQALVFGDVACAGYAVVLTAVAVLVLRARDEVDT